MWAIWVLTVMMALSGYYMARNEAAAPTQILTKSMDLVHSMGGYQAAVEAYARLNPTYVGSVPDTSLSFPTWYVSPSPQLWTNNIANDGTITVYTVSLLPISIASDLASYAKYSRLVGIANTATGRLD